MSSNLDQLTDWLKENKITEVECLISDLTGITRGKISPTNKFIAEKGMRLPESVLLQTVTGDYVDDDIYYELLDPADIDMICRPDENAVFLVPWAIEPTAQVIHDTYDKMATRSSCRRATCSRRCSSSMPSMAGSPSSRRKWSST